LKRLNSASQLGVLLDKMEAKDLVRSTKEETGQKKRRFSINQSIICNPIRTKEISTKWNPIRTSARLDNDDRIKDEQEVRAFFFELSKKDRGRYFAVWCTVSRFDFMYFLEFLMNEAKGLKMERVYNLLSKHKEFLIDPLKSFYISMHQQAIVKSVIEELRKSGRDENKAFWMA